MNIVLNVRDAMPGGETVTLATSGVEDGCVALRCADTGTGIPLEQLDRVFDAFYTTKAVGKGTGLGLFIAHKIIQEHEGVIAVRSRPGRGTTFTISLPASPSMDERRLGELEEREAVALLH